MNYCRENLHVMNDGSTGTFVIDDGMNNLTFVMNKMGSLAGKLRLELITTICDYVLFVF